MVAVGVATGTACSTCSLFAAGTASTAPTADCHHVAREKLGHHARTAAITAPTAITPRTAFTAGAPGTPGGVGIPVGVQQIIGGLGEGLPTRTASSAGLVGTGALASVASRSARHFRDRLEIFALGIDSGQSACPSGTALSAVTSRTTAAAGRGSGYGGLAYAAVDSCATVALRRGATGPADTTKRRSRLGIYAQCLGAAAVAAPAAVARQRTSFPTGAASAPGGTPTTCS